MLLATELYVVCLTVCRILLESLLDIESLNFRLKNQTAVFVQRSAKVHPAITREEDSFRQENLAPADQFLIWIQRVWYQCLYQVRKQHAGHVFALLEPGVQLKPRGLWLQLFSVSDIRFAQLAASFVILERLCFEVVVVRTQFRKLVPIPLAAGERRAWHVVIGVVLSRFNLSEGAGLRLDPTDVFLDCQLCLFHQFSN